jgi:para-nitrobenzyl esterase
MGAPHAFEIEYALGNLNGNPVYAWTADDRKVSDTMLQYFANFIKKGDPNGQSLPKWKPLTADGPSSFINIDVQTRSEVEKNRERYLFLDEFYNTAK